MWRRHMPELLSPNCRRPDGGAPRPLLKQRCITGGNGCLRSSRLTTYVDRHKDCQEWSKRCGGTIGDIPCARSALCTGC